MAWFYCITCIICIISLIILIILSIKIRHEKSIQVSKYNFAKLQTSIKSPPTVYLCITTIPERFHSSWFENNLIRLLKVLKGKFKIHYSIPNISTKGKQYIISKSLKALQQKDPRIIFYRCKQDYGPITKIRGALDNPEIPENAPLLICDDDIAYHEYFVTNILHAFLKDQTKIYAYCYNILEGYKGFMATKKTLRRVETNNPPSCFRIDDDVLQLNFNKDEIIGVPYGNDRSWYCSFDRNIHDNNTPNWINQLRNDNRKPMSTQCAFDFKSMKYATKIN